MSNPPMLKSLDAGNRRIIGEDIKDIEFSWPIGMPLVRSGEKYGRSEATCRMAASPAFCFVWSANAWRPAWVYEEDAEDAQAGR